MTLYVRNSTKLVNLLSRAVIKRCTCGGASARGAVDTLAAAAGKESARRKREQSKRGARARARPHLALDLALVRLFNGHVPLAQPRLALPVLQQEKADLQGRTGEEGGRARAAREALIITRASSGRNAGSRQAHAQARSEALTIFSCRGQRCALLRTTKREALHGMPRAPQPRAARRARRVRVGAHPNTRTSPSLSSRCRGHGQGSPRL